MLRRQAREGDAAGGAAAPDRDDVEEAVVPAGDELDVLGAGCDGRACVRGHQRGADGGRGQLGEERP